MILENRYGVPSETIQRMVNDGIIPCSVINHYAVYEAYQQFKSQCGGCTDASVFRKVEDATGVDFDNIKKIVSKLGKI